MFSFFRKCSMILRWCHKWSNGEEEVTIWHRRRTHFPFHDFWNTLKITFLHSFCHFHSRELRHFSHSNENLWPISSFIFSRDAARHKFRASAMICTRLATKTKTMAFSPSLSVWEEAHARLIDDFCDARDATETSTIRRRRLRRWPFPSTNRHVHATRHMAIRCASRRRRRRRVISRRREERRTQ